MTERVQVTATRPSGVVAQAESPRRIRVGGNVQAARLIRKVTPVYPQRSKQQGIEGVVLLRAVIGKDGSVLSATVINTANEDMAASARQAVEQWLYQPTLLNGAPVEVLTTITVNFQLQ